MRTGASARNFARLFRKFSPIFHQISLLFPLNYQQEVARLAQLAERESHNLEVVSSSLTSGKTKFLAYRRALLTTRCAIKFCSVILLADFKEIAQRRLLRFDYHCALGDMADVAPAGRQSAVSVACANFPRHCKAQASRRFHEVCLVLYFLILLLTTTST